MNQVQKPCYRLSSPVKQNWRGALFFPMGRETEMALTKKKVVTLIARDTQKEKKLKPKVTDLYSIK